MAVIVSTSDPIELLETITLDIGNGKIKTWQENAGFITHSATQYIYKAWFRPIAKGETLTFLIVPKKGGVITKSIYGIYHGRLIEMILSHYDQIIDGVTATPLPTSQEIVRSRLVPGP